MNKTQRTFFAVLTALSVCGLVFAAIAVKATVAWVIAWVVTIIFTLAWVLGFFAHVSNKGKKVVWQSIIGLVLLFTYIVLLMGGTVRGGNDDPADTTTTTSTTTTVEETTETTTVEDDVLLDTTANVETTKKQSASTTSKVESTTKKQSASTTSKVETSKHTHSYTTVTAAKTTYEVSGNGHNKVTTAAVKKCSCGATAGGEVSKKFESHSYNGSKCVCGSMQETTTAHTHSYTTVTAAKTTYEVSGNGHNKVTTAAVKKCSCGATTGGEVSKKFETHSYNGGKCSCGAVEPRLVLKARDTSEKTGYLRATPEDTVSIIIYRMEDINQVSYTWTDEY